MRPVAGESCVLLVRVTPRSSRDEVVGWDGDTLRVRLRAPPVEGRANEALCRFLAAKLGVALSGVSVVSGASARTKRVRVQGTTEAVARAAFTAQARLLP